MNQEKRECEMRRQLSYCSSMKKMAKIKSTDIIVSLFDIIISCHIFIIRYYLQSNQLDKEKQMDISNITKTE